MSEVTEATINFSLWLLMSAFSEQEVILLVAVIHLCVLLSEFFSVLRDIIIILCFILKIMWMHILPSLFMPNSSELAGVMLPCYCCQNNCVWY